MMVLKGGKKEIVALNMLNLRQKTLALYGIRGVNLWRASSCQYETDNWLKMNNTYLRPGEIHGESGAPEGFLHWCGKSQVGGGGARGPPPENFWNLRWLNHPIYNSCSSTQTISKLVVIRFVGLLCNLLLRTSFYDCVL